jgi:uncharacterized protein YcfJ
MPLQIRRGTEAERIAMVPKLANGELLWITDAKKLYVGDGVLASSVLAPVTGFNAEDAQDAAALLFTTTPTHSNITFAYDDLAGTLTATVNLSNYVGTIKASSFNGSLVADDSTTLVDAISGTFNGNLVGNVTGNTAGVHTGAVVGNVTGNTAGVHTGNVTGDVTGNTEGYHTGDVKGSVFADNSSLLVDSVDRIFFGTIDTGDTVIDTNSLVGTNFSLGTTTSTLDLTLNLDNDLEVRQVADPINGRFVTLNQSRGTLTSPAAVQAGDELGGFSIKAYTNTTTSALAGAFGFVVDATATIAGGNFIKSKAIISAASDTTADLANALILDSAGVTTSNAFVASKYTQLAVYADDAARTSAIATPAKGMMVFMTAGTSPTVTNKAVIYDGSAWVALH